MYKDVTYTYQDDRLKLRVIVEKMLHHRISIITRSIQSAYWWLKFKYLIIFCLDNGPLNLVLYFMLLMDSGYHGNYVIKALRCG